MTINKPTNKNWIKIVLANDKDSVFIYNPMSPCLKWVVEYC